MLLWQLKKRNKLYIIAHLFCCIWFIHFLILTIFFIVKSPKKVFYLNVGKNPIASNIPIIFAPLKESAKVINTQLSTQRNEQQKKVVSTKQIKTKNKVEEKKQTIVAPNNPEKRVESKQNKSIVKKENSASTKKKSAVQAQKKEAPMKTIEQQSSPVKTKQQVENAVQQEVAYVNATELEQLTLQQYIQQEIGEYFRPPHGLEGQLQCQVRLSVNADGSVKESAIMQSSGVLIYDLAAEHALNKILSFPEWARSKEFIISFNQ